MRAAHIGMKWLLFICMICTMIACSSNNDKPPTIDMTKPFKLVVAAADYDFQDNSAALLNEMFPQMEVEMVPQGIMEFALANDLRADETTEQTMGRVFAAYLDKEQPDLVIYSNPGLLRVMSEMGRLEPLDTRIKQDGYDIDSMYAPVMELVRSYGGGRLYGIPMAFQPELVVYFNTDLFNQYGVPIPEAPYTINDLIASAGRFVARTSDASPIYGLTWGCGEFSRMNIGIVNEIAKAQKLTLFNNELEMTFDSPSWEQTLQPLEQSLRSGVVRLSGKDGGELVNCEDAFAASAITVGDANSLQILKAANQSDGKLFPAQVSVQPVSEERAEQGRGVPKSILSIVKGSPVSDQAWEVVKALTGDTISRKLAVIERDSPVLPMRSKLNYRFNNISFDPFYAKNKFEPEWLMKDAKLDEAYGMVYPVISEQMDLMLKEKRTLKETMQSIQRIGNEKLSQYKQGGIYGQWIAGQGSKESQ